jgi:prepilin-type processing-associated H-X9-DG protein
MRANPQSLSPHQPPPDEHAFTKIDLLVILAVIALLLTLHVSALTGARDQTLRAQCAGNLHKLAFATTIFANDNSDKLPVNVGGTWAWDMSWSVGNMFTNFMPVQTLYCPDSGFNSFENNLLWNYGPPGSIHVIGYAQTFLGTATLPSTNVNATLTPQRIVAAQTLPAPSAARRVLFADSTMSANGQSNPALVSQYQWVNIAGGFVVGGQIKPHRTSHMDGRLPAGGNLTMLDGHVEWRAFPLMVPQTTGNSSGVSTPIWWW